MNRQVKATESEKIAVANQAAAGPADSRQKPLSHPREVATAVLAQMNRINAKKDELTIAIKGLTDITQQLANAYAAQMQVIEQLANRVKSLEQKAGASGADGPAAAQDKRVA